MLAEYNLKVKFSLPPYTSIYTNMQKRARKEW